DDQLAETVASGRDADQGLFEKSCVENIRKDLDLLEQAIQSRTDKPQVGALTDEEIKNVHLRALAKVTGKVRQDMLDLRESINEELDRQLRRSRDHYQGALVIILPSSIVGLFIMVGFMWSFYAWLFNPIRDLAAGVGRVAQGDLAHRIDLH